MRNFIFSLALAVVASLGVSLLPVVPAFGSTGDAATSSPKDDSAATSVTPPGCDCGVQDLAVKGTENAEKSAEGGGASSGGGEGSGPAAAGDAATAPAKGDDCFEWCRLHPKEGTDTVTPKIKEAFDLGRTGGELPEDASDIEKEAFADGQKVAQMASSAPTNGSSSVSSASSDGSSLPAAYEAGRSAYANGQTIEKHQWDSMTLEEQEAFSRGISDAANGRTTATAASSGASVWDTPASTATVGDFSGANTSGSSTSDLFAASSSGAGQDSGGLLGGRFVGDGGDVVIDDQGNVVAGGNSPAYDGNELQKASLQTPSTRDGDADAAAGSGNTPVSDVPKPVSRPSQFSSDAENSAYRQGVQDRNNGTANYAKYEADSPEQKAYLKGMGDSVSANEHALEDARAAARADLSSGKSVGSSQLDSWTDGQKNAYYETFADESLKQQGTQAVLTSGQKGVLSDEDYGLLNVEDQKTYNDSIQKAAQNTQNLPRNADGTIDYKAVGTQAALTSGAKGTLSNSEYNSLTAAQQDAYNTGVVEGATASQNFPRNADGTIDYKKLGQQDYASGKSSLSANQYTDIAGTKASKDYAAGIQAAAAADTAKKPGSTTTNGPPANTNQPPNGNGNTQHNGNGNGNGLGNGLGGGLPGMGGGSGQQGGQQSGNSSNPYSNLYGNNTNTGSATYTCASQTNSAGCCYNSSGQELCPQGTAGATSCGYGLSSNSYSNSYYSSGYSSGYGTGTVMCLVNRNNTSTQCITQNNTTLCTCGTSGYTNTGNAVTYNNVQYCPSNNSSSSGCVSVNGVNWCTCGTTGYTNTASATTINSKSYCPPNPTTSCLTVSGVAWCTCGTSGYTKTSVSNTLVANDVEYCAPKGTSTTTGSTTTAPKCLTRSGIQYCQCGTSGYDDTDTGITVSGKTYCGATPAAEALFSLGYADALAGKAKDDRYSSKEAYISGYAEGKLATAVRGDDKVRSTCASSMEALANALGVSQEIVLAVFTEAGSLTQAQKALLAQSSTEVDKVMTAKIRFDSGKRTALANHEKDQGSVSSSYYVEGYRCGEKLLGK